MTDRLEALKAEVMCLDDGRGGTWVTAEDYLDLSARLTEAEARAADAYEEAAQVADAVFKMRGETPQGYTAESIASDIRALGARIRKKEREPVTTTPFS